MHDTSLERTEKQHKRTFIWIIVIIAVIAILFVWNAIANSSIHVSYHYLQTGKNTEQLRIVQISDFHNDKDLGDKLIAETKALDPDIIAVTGDLIDASRTDIPYAVSIAEKLVQIAPVYYVTGNHEASVSSYDELKLQLEDLGVIVMDGFGIEIKDGITLYGIDDPLFDWDGDAGVSGNIQYLLDQIDLDDNDYNILLSHRPVSPEVYKDFDLVLSGHAHGGQFRIPFIGGVIAPDQGFFPEYDAGEYTEGKTTMIVSRGIGNSIIPLRINNPPELVVVDINGII